MSLKFFVSPPIGWGSLNLLVQDNHTYKPVVVTDGGTLRNCINRISKFILHTISYGIESHVPRVWIISHFDYDHTSIASQFFERNRPALCLLPYVYEIQEFRRTLAVFLAFMSMLIKVPKLPDIIESIVKTCHHKVLVDDSTRLLVDDWTLYEFLWPSRQFKYEIVKACKKMQEKIWDKVREMNMRKEVLKVYEDFLTKLDESGDDERRGEIDLRELDQQYEHQERDVKPYGAPPEHSSNLELSKRLSCTYRQFRELARIRRQLLNIYSIAYILCHQGKADHIIWDVNSQPSSLNTWLCGCSSNCLSFKSHSTTRILFLGDLNGNTIGEVLKNVAKHADIVIAAHHGNSWNNEIRGRLVYVQRCSEHPPKAFINAFRWEYCINMLCIIGEHNYGFASILH